MPNFRKNLDAAANILVLGATGMLGSALFYSLPKIDKNYHVFGTTRGGSPIPVTGERMTVVQLNDVFDRAALLQILKSNNINVVVNAIGLIKQIGAQITKADFIQINAWLPHYIMDLCDEVGVRFIEVSTDCVFTGDKGNYSEEDIPDAKDIYGVTKLMGEVTDNPNAITIRTSIIGHESGRAASLIDWFLASNGAVNGYKRAIFSGFPTVVIADILGRYILPRTDMHGLYHVSADPIDKFSLLNLVAKIYNHDITILSDEKVILDRSLNSNKFRELTGYSSPEWPELIQIMKSQRPNWK